MSLGEKPTPHDIEVVSEQLGRPARDIVGIPARCVCGNPLVVATNPRLEDGTPFPTLYYLTQPAATQAASRLEAEGKMAHYQERLNFTNLLFISVSKGSPLVRKNDSNVV